MASVEGLTKRFRERRVLDDFTLRIDDHRVTTVIGPSGSGKTTLLRCINRLEVADSGIVEIAGERWDLEHLSRGEEASLRRSTATVFQNYNLFRNLTARENIALGLRHARGVSKQHALRRADELLAEVGLTAWADSYPSRLSGGQQQRVGIARAMALEPALMLFDEPTSALDPELVTEVLQVIRRLAETGQTMLIITHEMSFARDISDRVVLLEDGRIVEEAAPEPFFAAPRHERTRQYLARYARGF